MILMLLILMLMLMLILILILWYDILQFDLFNVSNLFEHFAPETPGSSPRKSKTFPRDLILGLQIWVYIPDT